MRGEETGAIFLFFRYNGRGEREIFDMLNAEEEATNCWPQIKSFYIGAVTVNSVACTIQKIGRLYSYV